MGSQLLWKLLSQEQQASFLALDGAAAKTTFLAEALGLQGYAGDARTAIKLDYYLNILSFARGASLGPEQTSALTTIASLVLETVTGGGQLEDAHAALRSVLIPLTTAKPRPGTPVFAADEAKAVAAYFAGTLFRHFLLYRYVYTLPQEPDHTDFEVVVETAMPAPPFAAAKTAEQLAAWKEERAAAQRAREDAEAAAVAEAEAAAAAAAAEAERLAAEEAKRTRRPPQTLDEAIAYAVEKRMDVEQARLAAEYRAKEAEMAAKMDELQAAIAAAPPPPPPPASKKK